MIKRIFKRKNIYVLETEVEDGNQKLIRLDILDFKNYKCDTHTYPQEVATAYIDKNKLRKATYGELEDVVMDAHNKIQVKVDKLVSKLREAMNPDSNVEYRHFAYEYKGGLSPLLTEGVLRPLALINRVYDTIDSFNIIPSLIAVDDELSEKARIILPNDVDNDPVLSSLYTNDYCECVMKAKNYVFEPDLLSELEDDEKDIPEEVPVQEE